jgi:hypothetical protein
MASPKKEADPDVVGACEPVAADPDAEGEPVGRLAADPGAVAEPLALAEPVAAGDPVALDSR